MDLQIRIDPLSGPEVAALLREHLDEMQRISPPESVHALDLAKLRQADVTFWSAWSDGGLVGCAALMRRIFEQAEQRGYRRLSLETGSQPEFAPARALYRRFGFAPCGPFGGYAEDPCSTFMTRTLAGAHNRDER